MMEKKSFNLFAIILVQQLLISLAKNIEQNLEVSQAFDGAEIYSDKVTNEKMFLFKTSGQSPNYLNYKAVYGLRYIPTRKPKIVPSQIVPFVDNQTFPNISISEQFNNTIEDQIDNSLVASNSIENIPQTIKDSSTESSEKVQVIKTAESELVTDESRKHIMRPNHRIEHAVEFLVGRLKKLMLQTSHKNRSPPKLSHQLTTLGRFINLFSLIKVENLPCTTAMKPLKQLSGTCYSENECLNIGGTAVDRCANGFGVCCIFKRGCNSFSVQNVTYFESPEFPRASQGNLGTCTLALLLSLNVQQILIEFLFFELLPPTNGDCLDDKFIVSGQNVNINVPTICGIASGQHMYVDVSDIQRIQFSVITKNADDRAFSIKITQLRDNLSPQNCLQYYTKSEDWIKTFNYEDYSHIQMKRRPSYFNGLNYAICIRRFAGACKITFTNELNGKEDIFELTNVDDNGNIVPSRGQAGVEIFSCQDDFIAINFLRLCGYKLNDGSISENINMNAPVANYMNGPIVIPFKTDNSTVGREKAKAFVVESSSEINFSGSLDESDVKQIYKIRNQKFEQISKKILKNFAPCANDRNYSATWSTVDSWIENNEVYPKDDPSICKVISALQQAQILAATNSRKGTQLKLNLLLEGNKTVYFKPAWYKRSAIIEGNVYSGKDRHNSEIIGFYLGALLDLRSTPIVVGRKINLNEVWNLADQELQSTITVRQNDSRVCLYGKCYYCKPSEAVCGNATHFIEGVLLYPIPGRFAKNKSPWQRTYKEGQQALWQRDSDNTYCDFVKAKLSLERVLDFIDAAIFDFLIQNGDRHHVETRNNRIVLIDNGKGFGNPTFDFIDILAPLYQCCMIRKTTFSRLLIFTGGSLSEILKKLTKNDLLHPVLNEKHFAALERRLLKIFSVVEFCKAKEGNSIFK